MKADILVREVMKAKPVIIEQNQTVLDAAKLMKKNKIGCIIIVEKKQPVGIITERDILKKVVADGLNPSEVKVKEVMTSPIIIIDPYVSIEEAMKTMGKCNIRRLPIIENGELIGIIAQKDISRISPILHEISREWHDIKMRDETYFKRQIFSGKCEDCGTLTPNLKNIDDRLLCEDCTDALQYE